MVSAKGSDSRDEITPEGFKTNSSGGIAGGISTGPVYSTEDPRNAIIKEWSKKLSEIDGDATLYEVSDLPIC